MAGEIILRDGYRAGVIAEVVAAHMTYYAAVWDFGLQFEAKVATELSAFLGRYDPARDLFLTATTSESAFIGSITIDGIHGNAVDGAHLRWFITTAQARGTGLGKRLLQEALAFCDAKAYARTYLTTFPGLDAARHLYEEAGFRLATEVDVDDWHGGVGEQLFERLLPTGKPT